MRDRRDQAPILLIGGGRHAAVILEAIRLSGRLLAGFVDDKANECGVMSDAPYLGTLADLPRYAKRYTAILALGQLKLRRRLIETYPGRFECVSHPEAIVSQRADVGVGSFVAAGAIVGVNARTERHVIINTRALVEHDCVIESNVHVGPGAVLGGGVRVGADTLIGLNASVKSNVAVGRSCVVGAGAVVVHDVQDGQVVVGVPARPIHRGGHRRIA